jgi:hypothetical protein
MMRVQSKLKEEHGKDQRGMEANEHQRYSTLLGELVSQTNPALKNVGCFKNFHTIHYHLCETASSTLDLKIR